VRHGEEIDMTERGRLVAMLVPRPDSRAKLAELVATGAVTPAAREWTRAPRRLSMPAGEPLASAVLDEQRADQD